MEQNERDTFFLSRTHKVGEGQNTAAPGPGSNPLLGNPDQTVARAGNDFVLNLSEVARLLRKGLWVIATTTFIGGLISAFAVLQVTPTFTATSQILLGQQSRADDALGNLFQGLELDNREIAGQIAIMESGPILSRVSETLNLEQTPEFNPALRPPPPEPGLISQWTQTAEDLVKRLLGANPDAEPTASNTVGSGQTEAEDDPVLKASLAEQTRLRNQEDYVGQLAGALRIRQQGSSALVNISYISTDPTMAAAVANTLADEYIAAQLEEKFSSTRRVTEGLNERIADLELRLEASERAVLEFRDQMLGTESGGSERLEQQIRELSSRFVDVSARRAELDAELREVGELIALGGNLAVVGLLDSEVVRQLQQERSDLQLRSAQLSARFDEGDSRLASLIDNIRQVEEALEQEVERLRSELASEAAVAQARERSIGEQLRNLERRYLTLSQQLIRLAQLEREAEASRLVYETFLTTFTQTSETLGLQEADARVISYAKPPPFPSAPNKKVSVALGLVAGFMCGIGLVFLRALFDNTINTTERLRQLLGRVPVAASFPVVRFGLWRTDPLSVLDRQSGQRVTEAARKLRNTVMLRAHRTGWKVAMVSAEPGEGKTTTSLLMAHAVATAGKDCVVVETDLRKGSISQVLSLPQGPDLVDVLEGSAELDEALVRDKATGIVVLPARPGAQDPGGLLMSDQMRSVTEALEARFDMIIYDTPPLMAVSDALPILRNADDIIMVVCWRRSKARHLRDCLNALREVGISLNYATMTMARKESASQNYHGY